MKTFLSPDAATSPGGTATIVTDTHIRHQPNVPNKSVDLLNVSQHVSAKWKDSPFIMLVWKTAADFDKDVLRFASVLNDRTQSGGNRQYMTHDLENLDHKIDDAMPFMKSKINFKFGPHDAKSRYASFGMIHRSNGGYEFPTDRQGRKSSLQLMVAACTTNGFTEEPYGVDFWKQLQSDYDKAIAEAATTSGDVSGYVGDLNTLRTSLRRVLHSILLLLEANYPDTFDQVRREWGFQKENY